MTHRAPIGIASMASILGLAVLAAGCGGDETSVPREGAWSQSERPSGAVPDAGANRTPEIREVRFTPEEARPDRPLRAVVDARDADGDVLELGYTWTLAGERIPSDGPEISVPPGLRRGDRIQLRVLASDGRSTSEAFTASVPVGNRPPRVTGLEVHVVQDGEDDPGRWVADPTAEDPDEDALRFRYEWTVGGSVLDHDEPWLARAGRKRGERIQLRVWASDGDEESPPMVSAPFEIGNSPPDIVSRPPTMDASGRFVYAVEARDRDGDRGLRYSLVAGPQGMTIDPFSGELRWTATVEDAGEHVVTIAVDDRNGGVTRQTFYVDVTTTGGPGRRG